MTSDTTNQHSTRKETPLMEATTYEALVLANMVEKYGVETVQAMVKEAEAWMKESQEPPMTSRL